jgi:CRP-like cAMP-binding protein
MPLETEAQESKLSGYSRSFEAGSVLYRDGEPAGTAFLLQSGRVRLFKHVGAMERSLRVVRPGELFGELGLLTGAVRAATAVALDDVVALAVGAASLSEVLIASPELGGRVLEQLIRRLRDAEDQIEILMVRDSQSKVVIALLKLAQRQATNEGPQQPLHVTPLELSAQVGLDPDSVKRIVLALREAGYVRISEEKVEIPDLEALQELYGLLGVKDQLRGGQAREGGRIRAALR